MIKQTNNHWAAALNKAINDLNVRIIASDIAVVIKDKFPKAEYHFLVLPFVDIPSIFHVSSLTYNNLKLS